MANTNVNVVQQIKFLLETELDEKSKIQVGKDLKSILEDAVIAFDKSETEKNLKPIVAMINSVLKKADMPIIDEGSITASFEKIANMSADTFQEAFNAAIKNNGGIRLSFNDMKLDDIIESINKVSESIEQLGNNTSNVKKSIEKDISDINGAVERMGTGKNADKSIKDALKYKPKTAKTYNDSGTKTINELYEEYDSAINWEDKAKAIIKYKKEYESYIAYLKKNKPKEISSFSNSKYGKLYGRIGNNIDPILKALENVLVVKRQMESGDLNNRQNELVDDRNKPWARESTLKAVHETLKGGLKVSADVPDSKKQNAIESENPKVPDTEKPDVIDTPKNKKTEKTNVDKKTINKEIKQSIQSILVDVFRDAAASSSKKWENTVDGDKEKYIKSSIQKRFGLNKDVSELLMADLIYASKSTDNFDSVFSDIYKDLLSIVTSIDGVDLATFKKNIEQSLQTQEQTQPSGDVAKKETSNNNSGIGKTELTDVLNNVTVKVQVVSDKDPVPENGANEKASVTINDESLKNVLSGLIYNVHVQSGDENSLGSELQEYEKLVNEDTSKMSKEELGEHNDKIERTYDTIISFFQDQDRADVGYSVEYGIGDGEINSEDLLKLLIQKLPIRVKSDYSDLENSKISSIDEKSLKALLEEIQYKVKIVGENKVETDKSDNKLIELINKLIANGIGERGAFLSSKDGSYIGFKEGDAHSTSADIEDYKKASKNGYDTRIHFHTAKTAAPSGDNRKTKENPYGGSDVGNWVKAFDYIKKQIIVTQNELLSFDLSNLTKEQLEAVRDAYEKDVIKYKEDSSLSKDELQVKMRQSLERLLQPYVGAMTAYKLPNVVSDTLEQKGSGSATTVNASIDTKDLSSAFENSTKDLAKEETLGDVKDFVKTIADSTNNGNVQDELQVDKEIQRQIKQETGNQEQRFDQLNDIASAYADIEDVEAAIKQFGEVYKQIVLMSDVEYRNIKPNKTGINILRKIASGDFDVSDYSGIEFQRVDKPINTTKNISINTSEITDAIRDNAVDTKDLAKEETLGNIGKDLKTIIDNTKQKDAPSNDIDLDKKSNVNNPYLLTDTNGKVVVVYRGLRDSFAGLVSNRTGNFGTDNLDVAKGYTHGDGKVLAYNVEMRNPLEIDGKNKLLKKIVYFGNAFENATNPVVIELKDLLRKIKELQKQAETASGYEKNVVIPQKIEKLQARINEISEDESHPYGVGGTDLFVRKAKKNGYDGVIFRDLVDPSSTATEAQRQPSNIIVTFDEKQMHLLETLSINSDENAIKTNGVVQDSKIENSTSINGTVNVVSPAEGNQIAQEQTLNKILEAITHDKTNESGPSDGGSSEDVKPDDGEQMRKFILQELGQYKTFDDAYKAGRKRVQYNGEEVGFGNLISRYMEQYLGTKFDKDTLKDMWQSVAPKFTPIELTKEDAIAIIREKIPDNLLEGWFRKGDSEYKPLLEQAVMSDDEIRNAALNIMWSNFKEFSGKDIGFKEFLNSEIPMYRGKNSENYTEYDDLLSFSFDPKVAEKFGKYVLETLIKPIETIGSLQTTGEAEALVYRKPLESRAEYKKWHDDMANVNPNLENNTSRLLTEEDVRNAEEAYDSATRKVNILTEELTEARKELEKLQQQADLYGYGSDMSPQQVGRVRSTLSKPENAKTSQNYSRAQYVVDMLKKGYNVAKTNSGDYGFARHDIGENVYNTITKTEYDYAVYLSEKIKELNVGWEEGLKILQSQNGQLEAAQQKVTGLESALSDANSAKDVMYDAQTVIHNAYNKQKNGQTEDSTVANNQKKIKSYEELVAIVNRYFELKSKLRDINVEYNDGIDGENYNPPIFTAMESIESMLENAQLDASNMDVFNALHEDGANAESAVKRIAAAIGIEVEQQERLNESMRDGIQVRKSLNQTEEQSLLPDSNKFNEKSFLDDAQKAEVVKLGEEYRVILSLLEKDDEKVSEVADALRERAKAIMNVIYAVRQNDSTPSETYKLLFGGSDAAARAISDYKKQSELVSGFDIKNIDNQSRQAAIDLIYKEVEAEKRLLEEKKSQEEAEKETYKTEFIAQYTKALEKEKSLINDIIELQKELNILEDSNDESKYSDVLRKWSDKRAELQDANDALYSAFVDVKPSDAERYIKELQSTNAPASKSLITTDTQSKSEENDMNVLLASVNAVTEAVKLKTRAFNTERSAVQLVVEDEVKALDVLENKLISIKQTLEGLMNNVGAGASDLASGLSNVNINVNYPENGKVEFNSTAIEQLVAAINGIPAKQQAVTTTAVGNVPATENTLLIIKESVAAINSKIGKGTKSGGGYKKTTKSDYTGSAFFGEKIKTRELELGKFVQQLNNTGKNTQKLQDMIRQLQTALQAVNSGESLSVYDQMFRQVKLLVSIDDLQRAPAEKDKIADYKQLIKFAKEYYKLVEKYEKAEDGSNRKRVLGNQKDAIEKFMSDNGINLGNIAFDDENYNKQLSDLRIKHSNNMAEIDAANKDKSNKKALQEEQAEVKKLIDLYRDLGEEVAKRDYAETKESKDAHQKTINEIAKKIRGSAYYDKVNKQDAINAMRESAANKSASLRQSQADKAGAQRVRDENKALKEQEKTITELEAMYKNLGKAMAEVEVNGDLKKKERASQLQKEIDIKIQGLKLEKDEEDTLREKLNIIKETEKENSKALLVAQNKQKDNKKELNKQVRTSRQKARIGRANSTINGAEDAIYNAGVIDSVDASEVAEVQSLNTELEKLKGLYAAIQANDGVVSESDAQQLVDQTRLVKAHATELNKLLQQYERLSGDNVKEIVSYDAKGNLEKQLINAAKAATNGRAEIKGFNEETGELVAIVKGEKNSFTECTYAVREYDNQIVQVTGTTKKMEGFMDGILRKMKEIFMYFSGSSVVYKLFNELRQGIQYVREIDSALTELKKVTDETDESYSKFLDTASKTADKVGSTIKDIVSSTADWARLGFSLEDAANLAESTSILLNVSEFQSIDDATSALVSTMQAFGYAAKDSMHVVDVMNEIGKLLPIDNYIG